MPQGDNVDSGSSDAALRRQALQDHGHTFQYAVIKAIQRANEQRGMSWQLIGSEVPLSLNGEEVHADFIVQHGGLYLVAECKRVNPAYSEWLFARTKLATGQGPTPATVEELFYPDSAPRPSVRPHRIGEASHTYQVGVTVKVKKKGEGCVSDKSTIEATATQVNRAVGGFLELCAENEALTRRSLNATAVVIPVIFTTADLYVCLDDLEVGDLSTGNLPDGVTFERRSFIWYQRGLSKSMRAKLQGREVAEQMPTWSEYFRRVAVRAVAVVSVGGISDFLDRVEP